MRLHSEYYFYQGLILRFFGNSIKCVYICIVFTNDNLFYRMSRCLECHHSIDISGASHMHCRSQAASANGT